MEQLTRYLRLLNRDVCSHEVEGVAAQQIKPQARIHNHIGSRCLLDCDCAQDG